ncbi:MAG: ASCH domain-containing protein [Deltaproteobacteria bacterium]|nr:ASCH domain-containing protein [Deltaproteobacteria bacterium]
MKVLLSIKPEFVHKISSGKKLYEYRKAIYSKRDIKRILIYSTKPVGMIVGEFYVDDIIEEHPDKIWEKTKEYSGIKKSFYDNYFKGRQKGYAIKIGEKNFYEKPINPYELFDSFTPPQSFLYLSNKKYSASSILSEKLAV